MEEDWDDGGNYSSSPIDDLIENAERCYVQYESRLLTYKMHGGKWELVGTVPSRLAIGTADSGLQSRYRLLDKKVKD
ncbi:hypothetical protein PGT21_012195 [Puccinia graminis f. sp. tritici]|uniref:Uncharacterized protein n=1 Tax=Puccinia graminis f. sp. tritici TaxID=56615 RepID=A0A5B0P494_PUCGR|nr:hypothetical protein PGT21_000107 [Puccinia graminis f. sp. tritici]KAA1096301.1 hypothetical protein PGT21_012195 [Puccinia graminis f. sp. tritici]KAA1118504.1 hypothetical protein PGTUg99_011724 [Puccinia graminis f. sp. tritici]KAA1132126.1 hypothetical protein PGTUg99_037309 [Puccinia graminis f. sp. tritici]